MSAEELGKGEAMSDDRRTSDHGGRSSATPEAPVRLGPGSQELAPLSIYKIGSRFRGGE